MNKVLPRILISLLLVIMAGELLSRGLLQSPSPQIYDPELGFAYRPHAEIFWGYEGRATNTFNSLGLNSPEVGARLRPWRVLIVGDSYAEGRHVPRDQHFISAAERADSRLEVVNAGREGLNVANFPVVNDRFVGLTRPDLTVVVLSAGRLDDLGDGKVSTQRSPAGEISAVTYKIEGHDRIKEAMAPLLRNSALASALAYRFKGPLLGMVHDLTDLPRRLVRDSRLFEAVAAPQVSKSSAAVTTVAEEKLGFILRQMRATGPVAVLYMPKLDHQAHRQAAVSRHSREREDIMRRVADSNGIPFLSATPEFFAEQSLSGQTLHGFANSSVIDGHLNERGHRALGTALARLSASVLTTKPQEK